MRRFWRKLLSIFVSERPRRPIRPIEFVPTDIRRVDDELAISKAAKERGSAGLPSLMETEPDYMHRLILGHFQQKIAELHTDIQDLAQLYDAQFSQLGIERIPDRVHSATDRFRQSADSALVTYNGQLQALRQTWSNAQRAYDDFKRSYGVVRDAEYPISKVKFFAIPCLLLGFDAAFNSYVFTGADPTGTGIAGGIKVALIIAFINVAGAVVLGNGLRYLKGKGLFGKLVGTLSAAAALLYLPLNLFWAHYRDRAIELKNIDAFSFNELIKLRMHVLPDAWAQFMDHPLGISSIESWGLFVLGSGVVIGALIDGYEMSDPIPGFEDRHRALHRSQRALGGMHQKCIAIVEGAFGRICQELQKDEKSYAGLLASYEATLSSLAHLEAVYSNQSRDYVDACGIAVRLYQDHNRLARGKEPVPAYFNQAPLKPEVPPFPADVGLRTKRSKQLQEYAQRIAADVSAAINQMQAKRSSVLQEIGVNPTKALG